MTAEIPVGVGFAADAGAAGGVFAVIASVSSYQGRLYRYPFSVRLIS